MDDADRLLHEWLSYWAEQDHMPAKLPNALHVRTAVHLTMNGHDVRMPEAPPGPQTGT